MNSIETTFQLLKVDLKLCSSDVDRVNLLLKHNKQWEKETHSALTVESQKEDARSAEMRKRGNTQFKQRKYVKSLESYTSAVAFAKTDVIAALAYANRSAVLLQVGLCEESLADIERALSNKYPQESVYKLTSRRAKVLKRQTSESKKLLSYPYHQHDPSKSDNTCVENQHNATFGRHLTATRDIEIAEIMVVEKPYAVVLQRDNYIYCSQCLKLCYNLIPCDACPIVLYCSDSCKLVASRTHKYECCILGALREMGSSIGSLELGLKVTISILTQFIENKDMSRFHEIRKMESHTNSVSLRQRFLVAWVSGRVYTLLQLHTGLFRDLEGIEELFKELLPLCLQVVHINGVLISRQEPKMEGSESITYAHGFYFLYSMFNHSCYPNAFFYHEGSRLVVRALGTIKKGEQCFISYGYSYSTSSKLVRQTKLQENFYFTCTCRACVEDWPEESEEENKQFDEPFALVMMAQLKNDHELLRTMGSIFARRLKAVEQCAPVKGLTCLRQLVVDCHSNYESPKRVYKE